jgi:GNAT superfamily N-acetyltransferase
MLDQIVADHERRLRELDPLLPATHPWPEGLEDPVLVEGGAGAVVQDRLEPDHPAAGWRALEQYRLEVRVGRTNPVAAMDEVLNRLSQLPRTAEPDSSVILHWPSRDGAMTRVFLDHGLVPLSVHAARPAGRAVPALAPGIRPYHATDLDDAVALVLELSQWEEQFGQIVRRDGREDRLRASYAELGRQDEPWTWIAEVEGRTVGLLRVEPDTSAAMAGKVSGQPTAYVSAGAVTAHHRGNSIGSALVAAAHTALDDAGVALTTLHYCGLNPRSGPFWHRHGYRPLWTGWEVRPAAWMR